MVRVLVIEDDELALDLLAMMLEREGHDVVRAADGVKGVERFREGGIDVVVTDLVMPEMEGFQAIQEIRELDPRARILAISGGSPTRPPEGALAAAERLGADATLRKPFSRRQLVDALQAVLARE